MLISWPYDAILPNEYVYVCFVHAPAVQCSLVLMCSAIIGDIN